jgi:serine/threonine protein kinase
MGDLLRAEADALGMSAYGTMFKVMLEDGNILAVRRLMQDMIKGHEEFKAEIAVLGKVRHPNLLPLRAYYLAGGDVFIVFDYMPMGSLSASLHGETSRPVFLFHSTHSCAASIF